jgi:predicted alpha/beta hydrolase
MISPQKITCADGYPIALTFYQADRPEGVVIISSAIGIPKKFYGDFAKFLNEKNFHCITFSYRGTEDSLAKTNPFDVKLEDWGVQDIEAIIQFAKNLGTTESENLPIHFVGHSVGGQLLGLASSSSALNSMVFVASSCPYWKRWGFPEHIKMLLAPRVIFLIASLVRDEFPTRSLGLGSIKIPSKVAKQWASWMIKPDYLFDKRFGLPINHYQSLNQPLLSLGFKDDKLAPAINIKKLLSQFSVATVTEKIIDPNDLDISNIGHSGFFKAKFRSSLWEDTMTWINQHN